MFLRRAPSKDERYYIIEFLCIDDEGRFLNVYLDDTLLYRAFVNESFLKFLNSKIADLISKGRLKVKINKTSIKCGVASFSIKKFNRLIVVKLKPDKLEYAGSSMDALKSEMNACGFGISSFKARSNLMMSSLSMWRASSTIIEIIKNRELWEFIKLLESFRPVSEEKGITEFDGKTIHPISMKTLLSEFKIYSRGLIKRRAKDGRTVILLDRSLSMGNNWSPLSDTSKIEIGRFLAWVIQNLHPNNHLFSFGRDIRDENDPYDIPAVDVETRLDKALREINLYNPEYLIIITDGRPIYSPKMPPKVIIERCIYTLDALSNSGVKILIVMLGHDPEMFTFYNLLKEAQNVTLVDLSAEDSSMVRMVQHISRYTYSNKFKQIYTY